MRLSNDTDFHPPTAESMSSASKFNDDGNGESFSSSEALSDDLERFFDRASFSIQEGINLSALDSSSPIEDPDRLRKGLSVLLDSRTSSNDPHESLSPPLDIPDFSLTPALNDGPAASMGLPYANRALTSISGVVFAHPFLAKESPSILSLGSDEKKPRARSHVRFSMVNFPKAQVPPVPAITEAYRSQTSTVHSSITSNLSSSPTHSILMNHRPSETKRRPLSLQTPSHIRIQRSESKSISETPVGTLTAYLPAGETSASALGAEARPLRQVYSGPSNDSIPSSEIPALVYPHSPVQIASKLPPITTLQFPVLPGGHEDPKYVDPPRQRQISTVVESMDPELKQFVDRRLKVALNVSVQQIELGARSLSNRLGDPAYY